MFKSFITRDKRICSDKYFLDEIRFLKEVFVENGDDKLKLDEITKNYLKRRTFQDRDNRTYNNIISLPWIPSVSNKLTATFKKFDIPTTFKSIANISKYLISLYS